MYYGVNESKVCVWVRIIFYGIVHYNLHASLTLLLVVLVFLRESTCLYYGKSLVVDGVV